MLLCGSTCNQSQPAKYSHDSPSRNRFPFRTVAVTRKGLFVVERELLVTVFSDSSADDEPSYDDGCNHHEPRGNLGDLQQVEKGADASEGQQKLADHRSGVDADQATDNDECHPSEHGVPTFPHVTEGRPYPAALGSDRLDILCGLARNVSGVAVWPITTVRVQLFS